MKNRKAKMLIAKPGQRIRISNRLVIYYRYLGFRGVPLFVFTVSGETEAQHKTAGKTTFALKESDMTTFTDKELIKEIKERIGSLDVRDNIERRAYEIALASLEADPVAYIFKHPAGKLFWALTDESNKDQSDVIPVYAAAPASVVPDNASEPLAYAYKELTPEIMRNHLAVFERYGIAPNDSSTTIQALRIALDGIERSGAMLHGAEPVSQTYKLPPCHPEK